MKIKSPSDPSPVALPLMKAPERDTLSPGERAVQSRAGSFRRHLDGYFLDATLVPSVLLSTRSKIGGEGCCVVALDSTLATT